MPGGAQDCDDVQAVRVFSTLIAIRKIKTGNICYLDNINIKTYKKMKRTYVSNASVFDLEKALVEGGQDAMLEVTYANMMPIASVGEVQSMSKKRQQEFADAVPVQILHMH